MHRSKKEKQSTDWFTYVRTTAWGKVLYAALVVSICCTSIVLVQFALLFFRADDTNQPPPFPISVYPAEKKISEDPTLLSYWYEQFAEKTANASLEQTLSYALSALSDFSLYENLAAPLNRTLVIHPGERHEEVVKNFGTILGWNTTEREVFMRLVASSSPAHREGVFYPGKYSVPKGTSPEVVAQLVIDRFQAEIVARYTTEIAEQVPLSDALIIASLLEREAYDFDDMRKISGVIWNRLFIDMKLQIDSTLQYAKGSLPYGPWWPPVLPQDKYIRSSYNTYTHTGLPPAPIANPSAAAVLAALNPVKTECLFYFHNAVGAFFCTPTYEEHVSLLRQEYGRGR